MDINRRRFLKILLSMIFGFSALRLSFIKKIIPESITYAEKTGNYPGPLKELDTDQIFKKGHLAG